MSKSTRMISSAARSALATLFAIVGGATSIGAGGAGARIRLRGGGRRKGPAGSAVASLRLSDSGSNSSKSETSVVELSEDEKMSSAFIKVVNRCVCKMETAVENFGNGLVCGTGDLGWCAAGDICVFVCFREVNGESWKQSLVGKEADDTDNGVNDTNLELRLFMVVIISYYLKREIDYVNFNGKRRMMY